MNGKPYSAAEEEFVRREYPHRPTSEVAQAIGRKLDSVYRKAFALGLAKTEEYLASPAAYRWRRDYHRGWEHRFPKGHVPANAGTRRPGYAPGRMRETQFKKGHRSQNWMPIGSHRFSKEGYLQRKISDTGYPPHDWVGEHILLWREKRGAVPACHAVCFRDGDKTNITLENLEMISRSELMRRNTIHNRYPDDVKCAIQMAGALRRRIREKEGKPPLRQNRGRKVHGKQNVGRAGASV